MVPTGTEDRVSCNRACGASRRYDGDCRRYDGDCDLLLTVLIRYLCCALTYRLDGTLATELRCRLDGTLATAIVDIYG